ncbi:MAG: ATP-grasp domain-containing protein, partial [Methyloligellaceae bacterium]
MTRNQTNIGLQSTVERAGSTVHVLLTGAGSGSANNLMRSLRAGEKDVRICGCHHDSFVLAKSDADRSFIAPNPADTGFDSAIRNILEDEQIDLIIPVSDDDTLAVARIRNRLPCRTFLPATPVIELCQDKFELVKHLESAGIRVPVTFPVRNRADVAAAFRQLGQHPLLWCRTRTGYGSRAATMVKDEEQAWHWIKYWNEMRDVAVDEFTLSEYLPGRDFNVQGLWHEGHNLLIKMCERLSYLDGGNRPSGMSSTPALAKTIEDDDALELCESAIEAIDPNASGVFNFDLKQDVDSRARITEINAGRFAMITNIYDLTGRHNMAQSLVGLALGEP